MSTMIARWLFSWFRDFFRQLRMLRLEFAGRKAYHGGNFSNILNSVFCGAVFYFAVGQLWHTNQLFRVLCARPALPQEILEGKNEKFLAHKSPKLEIVR